MHKFVSWFALGAVAFSLTGTALADDASSRSSSSISSVSSSSSSMSSEPCAALQGMPKVQCLRNLKVDRKTEQRITKAQKKLQRMERKANRIQVRLERLSDKLPCLGKTGTALVQCQNEIRKSGSSSSK